MTRIRIQRLESELLKLISTVVNFKLRDKNLAMVTVTHIRLSNDLSQCRIYYSHLDLNNKNAVATAFKKSAGFIKREIAAAKFMRIIPELSFEYDTTEEKARHLEDLFSRIHNENKDEN